MTILIQMVFLVISLLCSVNINMIIIMTMNMNMIT